MTKCKRLISVVSIISVLTMFLSVFSISASAATGKSKKFGVFQTKVITVSTQSKGSPSITFKSIGNSSFEGKNAKPAILSLKVYNHSNRTTKYYRVTGPRWYGNSISSKLSLNKNTKYTLTVSYIYDRSINWGKNIGIGMYKHDGYYDGLWMISASNRCTYTIR